MVSEVPWRESLGDSLGLPFKALKGGPLEGRERWGLGTMKYGDMIFRLFEMILGADDISACVFF